MNITCDGYSSGLTRSGRYFVEVSTVPYRDSELALVMIWENTPEGDAVLIHEELSSVFNDIPKAFLLWLAKMNLKELLNNANCQ